MCGVLARQLAQPAQHQVEVAIAPRREELAGEPCEQVRSTPPSMKRWPWRMPRSGDTRGQYTG